MAYFIITVLESLVLIALAVMVFNSRRDDFLNRSFSLFLIFLSLWVLCGFPQELVREPGDYFITIVFRLAHCTAILGTGAFFLFSLGFLLGHKPSRTWIGLVSLSALLLGFCSMTDLVVRRASFAGERFFITYGPVYPVLIFALVVLGGGGIICIDLKRRRSLGIDRTRAAYILIGFGIFFVLAMLLTVVIPAIQGTDTTSNYTFLLVIIPTGLTAYAMMRHRLLDVRVAVRRTFAYLLTLIIFGAPLLALYAAFRYSLKPNPNLEIAISILVLALAIALAPAVLRWSNRIAARLFFTGLFDDVELLHRVSVTLTSTSNIRDGIISTTSYICEKLGLSELHVAIPDEATRGKGNWVIGNRREGKRLRGYMDVEAPRSPLFLVQETTVFAGDDSGGLRGDEPGSAVLEEMRSKGLAACLPLKGPGGSIGSLLVGTKVNESALDPLDLDFLGQFAERVGLFVENYLLSMYLLSQFEELAETRKRLEDSDRFKTDIINVTSHELRTPLTILIGYAYTLHDHYDRFSEVEHKLYLEYMISSCERLNGILDQFLTVSYLQDGSVKASFEPIDLNVLLHEVKAGFPPEQAKRIESEIVPGEMLVLTDRSYLLLLLKNLVENAIRFSPPELPVIIEAAGEEGAVSVNIRDFGEGLEPDEVQDIFQPFTRLEDTDRHAMGTGLGLHIVRLIADMLDVTVDVESQPGSGTTFSLILPRP